MFDPPTPPSSTPEELLDHWLDALNDPNRSSPPSPPEEVEGLTNIARHYRQTLGATHATQSAVAERNGSMNHALPRSPSTSDTWQTIRPPQPQHASGTRGWISWLTNGLATTVVIALLVALGGAMIVQQTGLPGGSDDPTALPGIASQPDTTPESGSLSCASPGYRPVIDGGVDEQSLAMIGGTQEPIVSGDDEVTVPLADGGERSVPKGSYVTFDPGTVVTHFEDGSSMVTRLADGMTWDFPPVNLEDGYTVMIAGNGGYHLVPTITGNGRYYVAPTDDTGTNWYVLDTQTGERTTTAEILGEPFLEAFTSSSFGQWGGGQSSNDLSVMAIDFGSTAYTPNPEAEEASGAGPGALVIPGSLSDAYYLSQDSVGTVSPDGALLLLAGYNKVIDAETGERFVGVVGDDFMGFLSGRFVAFASDEPTILTFVDNEVRSLQPAIGGYEVVFEADGPIHAVGYDRNANSLVVGSGEPGSTVDYRERTNSMEVIGPDDLPASETWTWIDLDAGSTMPLAELSSYRLNRTSPAREVRHVSGVADFIHWENPDASMGQLGEPEIYSVRALDMRTGTVAADITNTLPPGDHRFGSFVPVIVEEGIVAVQTPSGSFLVRDTASDLRLIIPAPEKIDLSADPYLALSVSPNEQCLMLDVRDAQFNPVHNTFVAPIEFGASWTELDLRISQWVEIPDETDTTETLPAQEIASPAATPVD